MNKIDLINIRNIIADRKREKPNFIKNGTFSQNSLNELSTESLQDLEEVHVKYFNNIIKNKVDEIFKIFGKEGDNCIVISAANYYDDSRRVNEVEDDIMSEINFDDHDFNNLYYPVCDHWPRWRYNCLLTDKEQKQWDDYYMNYLNPLYDLVTLVYFNAEEYYREDNDALNEYWYGVIAITKDYKLITFVIRNDGILCSKDSMNKGYNKIISKL